MATPPSSQRYWHNNNAPVQQEHLRKKKPVTFKMILLSAVYSNWRFKDYVQLVLDCPDDVPWCCQGCGRLGPARKRYEEQMSAGGEPPQEPQHAPPAADGPAGQPEPAPEPRSEQ